MRDGASRKQPYPEIGHLVTAEEHRRRRESCRYPPGHGNAIEGSRKAQPSDRPHGEAVNLADVLNAPRRRSAESEHERREQGRGGMPTAVPRKKESGHRAGEKQGEDCRIGHHETWLRRDQREQQEYRREDQRLWVGDLGMACEDIRVPPWPFATINRPGQEL